MSRPLRIQYPGDKGLKKKDTKLKGRNIQESTADLTPTLEEFKNEHEQEIGKEN
jgi:hypothetical protein